MNFRWSTALKIAWREARSSSFKFLFVILAVAVGVGSLTGVRGFSRAFHEMLLSQARTLMAADLSLRVFELPNPQQTAAMDALSNAGVQRTWITETLTMASGTQAGGAPMLVSIKAVDPTVYPFYGEIRISPPAPLKTALTSNTVAVSDDVLLRLHMKIGDTIQLGGQPFRIIGQVTYEPDRMLGSLNVGPRVMMTRAGLDHTGLMMPGSRAAERFLFRLTPGSPDIATVRDRLKKAFPEALIADFRETHPIITQGLSRATTFLSLVSLITLIVGAIGVATAMQAHIQQRMDSIAIMKCLGARSIHLMRIYLIQTIALGLAGGLLGAAFGIAIQRIFPGFLARYFQLEPSARWDLLTAAQGIGIAIMATLLFTLPPLLGIRRIRPNLILRREMSETKRDWRTRLVEARASIAAGAVIVIGIGGIAMSFATGSPQDIWKTGAYFAGALVVSLAVLSGIAWLMLRGLKVASRSQLPTSIRHGIANLYRPGNHAQTVLVALGIGVMFTLTVYLVQRGVITQMNRTAPPGMPNVFLIDISPKDRDPVLALLKQQRGIEGSAELIGTVAAKLIEVDGVDIQKKVLKGWARRFRYARSVTSAAAMSGNAEVLRGKWWNKPPAAPEICISEEAAKLLGVQPGSMTRWTISGRDLSARVACIHRIDEIHLASRVEFIFSSGALDGFPVIYYGALRVQPPAVPALQQALYDRYPTITVVNMADVLQTFQAVVDQIALVIRFISMFAILAGAIILASSVAGTRFRRMREVVILKTLGATRWRVSRIFSVEFLILGAVAGTMGALLANGFANLLLKRLLDSEISFPILPSLLAVVATALIANAAGWMASFRILGQKPLEILREE
ncbi:MAG TPA: FtsX-like permease family protein [Bryobacteraceae bacterium]|jgi:putative ABC transport system permease protein|nr:FtsX-like permease family protein [Bryobacteraceae bacterium]